MTISREQVDGPAKSRHAERVGDKPSKYWDVDECRWVACPPAGVVVPRALESVVPAQAPAAETVVAEPHEPPSVGSPR